MGSDIEERVKREAEYFDHRQSQRQSYEAALAYLNDGIGRQRRNEAVRAVMREADGARVLEIGSQSWEWCLARYDYRPAQLTCINISQAELDSGREQSAKLEFACDFRKMDAARTRVC